MDKQEQIQVNKHHKRDKWSRRILVAVMVVVALGAIRLYAWELQPVQVFKVTSKSITVVPPVVSPGGFVILGLDYCKMQSVTGTIRTSFVSKSTEVFQPKSKEKSDVGCKNGIQLPTIIPKDLVPDTYYIKFVVTYQLNPLKNEIEEFHTDKFEIK